METEWTDSLTEQAERLLDLASETREREHEINAAWCVRKIANLMQAGYRVAATPRLKAALRPFVQEE
jgi:hypothetical protein